MKHMPRSTTKQSGIALILFLGVCILSGCVYWHCVWSKRFRGPRSNMSRTVNIGEGNLVKKKPSFGQKSLPIKKFLAQN